MKAPLLVWLQVILEDTVSEFLYAPLFITVIASALAYFDVIPVPAVIFGSASVVLATVLLLRALWVLTFIRNSDPVVAHVGQKTGQFRKWVEHVVHVDQDDAPFDAKHSFLKKEVSEGELLLVLVHRRQKKRILVVRRMADENSLVG